MENEDILAQIKHLLEYFDTSEFNFKQQFMLAKIEDSIEQLSLNLEAE